MFKINGPVLAAVTLDNVANEVLRQADAIARFYGSDLHVCHVLPELLAVRPLFPHLHLDDALMASDHEASTRRAILDRALEITGRTESKLRITLQYGTPHSGILRVAERSRAGIIVVGGNQEEEGRASLGRISEQVVRHALSPVLVARPARPGKVLAATDFSDQALPAVQAGAAEAHRRRTELVLIHAVDLLPTIPALPPHLEKGIRETQRERLDNCVRRYEARGGGLLPDGPAAPAILRAAQEVPAQLLIVGTHGRTGLKRLVLGSVAESVMRGAHCSVLAVRLAV